MGDRQVKKLAAVLRLGGPRETAEPVAPGLDELRAAEELLLGEAVYALLTQLRRAPGDDTRRAVAKTVNGLGLTPDSFRDYEGLESNNGVILAAACAVANDRKKEFSVRTLEAEITRLRGLEVAGRIGSVDRQLAARTNERNRRAANWDPHADSQAQVLALSLATYERIKVAQDIVPPGGSRVVLDNRAVHQARAVLKTAADLARSTEKLDQARRKESSYDVADSVAAGALVGGAILALTAIAQVIPNFPDPNLAVMVPGSIAGAVFAFIDAEVGAQLNFENAARAARTVVTTRAKLHKQTAIPPPKRGRPTLWKGPGRS